PTRVMGKVSGEGEGLCVCRVLSRKCRGWTGPFFGEDDLLSEKILSEKWTSPLRSTLSSFRVSQGDMKNSPPRVRDSIRAEGDRHIFRSVFFSDRKVHRPKNEPVPGKPKSGGGGDGGQAAGWARWRLDASVLT